MHLTRNQQQQSIMARIMRENKMYQKSFSRKKYKTWNAAEAAAQRWVNKKVKELPPSQSNVRGRLTKSNNSGVVGVCRTVNRVKENDNIWEYPQWIAKWPECPVKGGIRWPINDSCNEDDAFVLAVISRQLKSVDRKEVRSRFNRIRGKKSHREILALRKK